MKIFWVAKSQLSDMHYKWQNDYAEVVLASDAREEVKQERERIERALERLDIYYAEGEQLAWHRAIHAAILAIKPGPFSKPAPLERLKDSDDLVLDDLRIVINSLVHRVNELAEEVESCLAWARGLKLSGGLRS